MPSQYKRNVKVQCVNCYWEGERKSSNIGICPVCDGFLIPGHSHKKLYNDILKLKSQVKKLMVAEISKAFEFEEGKKYLIVMCSDDGRATQQSMEAMSFQLKQRGVDVIVTNIPIKEVKTDKT